MNADSLNRMPESSLRIMPPPKWRSRALVLAARATACVLGRALVVVVLLSAYGCAAFGTSFTSKDRTHGKGDIISVLMDSLTSRSTQMAMVPSAIPQCFAKSQLQDHLPQSFGEAIRARQLLRSSFQLHVGYDIYCGFKCAMQFTDDEVASIERLIQDNYHHNWVVDGLPAFAMSEKSSYVHKPPSIGKYAHRLSKSVQQQKGCYRYDYEQVGGFPIGYIDHFGVFNLNNHFNIYVRYETVGADVDANKQLRQRFVSSSLPAERGGPPVDSSSSAATRSLKGMPKYRINGIAVHPVSIEHWIPRSELIHVGPNQTKLMGRLGSCPKTSLHLTLDQVRSSQKLIPNTTVMFTYDVIWEQGRVPWKGCSQLFPFGRTKLPSNEIRWSSAYNSMFLVAVGAFSLLRMAKHNLQQEEEEQGDVDEATHQITQSTTGTEIRNMLVRNLHGSEITKLRLQSDDVFQPPNIKPIALCVLVGNGCQVACTGFSVGFLAMIGWLHPSRRGSMTATAIVAFMMFGAVAGYVSSMLHRTLCAHDRSTSRQCAWMTAMLVPGAAFATFCAINATVHANGATATSVTTLLRLALMHLAICVPSVFVGAHFGTRDASVAFPTEAEVTIAKPYGMGIHPTVGTLLVPIAISAVLNVEWTFMIKVIQGDEQYEAADWRLLMLVFTLAVATTAVLTIGHVVFRLVTHNKRWWWPSFVVPASTGVVLLLYTTTIAGGSRLDHAIAPRVVFYGHVLLAAMAVGLALGSVGTLASLWFIARLCSKKKAE